jgi:hypothetical protein
MTAVLSSTLHMEQMDTFICEKSYR